MIEVHDRVYVGNISSCTLGNSELAIVHACKHPCHVNAVGYTGNLPRDHPNYLTLMTEHDLYLNIIDPDRPLFMPPLFTTFLEFASNHWDEGRRVLVHCNQGESRAPSLAMLLLAKHVGVISNDSYASAKNDFWNIYPAYNPGLGIQRYLSENWYEF